jgi:preprotein translocase subunit SecA
MEIYGLDVICIPTNRPVIRNDQNDLIFLTEKAKWNAIVDEIKEVAEAGRPVLVGTTSVEKSPRPSASG